MKKFTHLPVLAEEVVELLDVNEGDVVVDATLGLGGHAALILQRLGKTGKLIGIDRDEEALTIAGRNLRVYRRQISLACGNFANIDQFVESAGYQRVSGILFDLGVSSLQLDDPDRGFSFNKSDALDMRMNVQGELTAREVVNTYTQGELAHIFTEYGEERRAEAIAKRIVAARKEHEITSVAELVEIIGGYKGGKIHPATKVFQALRIEVNDELNVIREALPKAFDLLEVGGRLAVISFHSLEDRIVKNLFKELKAGGRGRLLTKKACLPSWPERKANPRARSAKLRVIEKL